MTRRIALAAAVFVAVALSGCDSEAKSSPAPPASRTIASGLTVPWGLAFLPDGTALVTERGRDEQGFSPAPARVLSIAPDGRTTEVLRLPTWHGLGGEGVRAVGESGLLGIAVSPHYATDAWIYIYFTYSRTEHGRGYDATRTENRIARFHLGGRPEPIVTGIPGADYHSGGRLAFGPDGMLYATTGETANTRGIAQDRASLGGKILRLTPDGRPAPGNPFPDSPVWSFGHRNVQGIAWDSRGRLYASEFGAADFDELNLIEPGRNYGWPLVEGVGHDPRYTDPIATWTPTKIASPSGIAVLGDRIYVACLAGQRLYRVSLDGRTIEPLLVGAFGRIRTVEVAPDGSLWLMTSNKDGRGEPAAGDDHIIRIAP